jgi:hypothetical protein
MNFRRDVVTDTYGSFLSDDEVRGQVKCGWNQDWMLVSIIRVKTQMFEATKFSRRILVRSSGERMILVNDPHRNGRSAVPAPRASWSWEVLSMIPALHRILQGLRGLSRRFTI